MQQCKCKNILCHFETVEQNRKNTGSFTSHDATLQSFSHGQQGTDPLAAVKHFDCIDPYAKMTPLVTRFSASVNSFLLSLWSQSLHKNLLIAEVIFSESATHTKLTVAQIWVRIMLLLCCISFQMFWENSCNMSVFRARQAAIYSCFKTRCTSHISSTILSNMVNSGSTKPRCPHP